MSDFAVTIERIEVFPHTNADRLEVAQVGKYQIVVMKGQYKSGDLVAYIPEQSILPQALIEELGLTGKLAGREKNRVKAVMLRGVLSQGLCYPARPKWELGADVAADLGITKYVPDIPSCLSGQVYGAGRDKTLKYDIENIKRYPSLFVEGEEVVFTEKLHGTFALMGLYEGEFLVSSKGLSAEGLAFKLDAEENTKNLYLRAARAHLVESKLRAHRLSTEGPLYVLGEVFGSGVQDLAYGASAGQDATLGFRVFDAYVGTPSQGRYLDDSELSVFVSELGLERVPVLYRGPYSEEVLAKYTDGTETVSGSSLHLREGIVLRPVKERRLPEIGRLQLKSVSAAYLLRKGDVTEYQ